MIFNVLRLSRFVYLLLYLETVAVFCYSGHIALGRPFVMGEKGRIMFLTS